VADDDDDVDDDDCPHFHDHHHSNDSSRVAVQHRPLKVIFVVQNLAKLTVSFDVQ
jgi:hypothetical protein